MGDITSFLLSENGIKGERPEKSSILPAPLIYSLQDNNQLDPKSRAMMSNVGSECLQSCEVACSQPCAYSRSLEPCVASCGDSRAVVFPPPVVLTFPGPTLSTCSQESVVGASQPMVLGAPIPNISDESYGVGGSFGAGSTVGVGPSFGSGGSFGYEGASGIRGPFGYGGSFGYGMQNSRGSCGYGGVLGAKGSFGSGGAFGYGGSSGMGSSCYGLRSRSSRGSYLGSRSSS